jgi:hypothetical protein
VSHGNTIVSAGVGLTLVFGSLVIVATTPWLAVVCVVTGLALLSLLFAGGPNPRV